jgi:hypothetical protein
MHYVIIMEMIMMFVSCKMFSIENKNVLGVVLIHSQIEIIVLK